MPSIQAYMLSCYQREAIQEQTLRNLSGTDWSDGVTVVLDESSLIRPVDRITESYLRILRMGVESDAQFLLILEDDLDFNRHIRHNLLHWGPLTRAKSHFFGSLYNPNITALNRSDDDHYFVADPDAVYASQAFVLSVPTALFLIEHWAEGIGPPDIKAPRLAARLSQIHYHVPSLVEHVGRDSLWGGPFHASIDFDPVWRSVTSPRTRRRRGREGPQEPTARTRPERGVRRRVAPRGSAGANALAQEPVAQSVPSLPRPQTPDLPAVVWSGALGEASGYAEAARNFVLALNLAGIPVHANPIRMGGPEASLSVAVAESLRQLVAVVPPNRFIHVLHSPPFLFRRDPRAIRNIGRTMFETDSLPPYWAAKCGEMDEIWVPSQFNVETFTGAGVPPAKLRVVPDPLETDIYNRAQPAMKIDGLNGFVFLSVFDWTLRKGWDVLVRAYVQEFSRDEDVTLALKVRAYGGAAAIQEELDWFLRTELRRDPATIPRIVLLDLNLPSEAMPCLLQAADAYVMPSRGEGWGRPYAEAMAMGLPTIGTRWGGNLDFMTEDNSYLVECTTVDVPMAAWKEFPPYRGHRWAESSCEHLSALMREVLEDRAGAAAIGRQARQDIHAKYSWDRVAELIRHHLEAADAAPRAPLISSPSKPRVVWEGPQALNLGMAIVNRELCRELLRSTAVDLDLFSGAGDGATSPPPPRNQDVDVWVRHEWPPNFDPPPGGRWVMVQPWEFGSLPRAWIEPMNQLVDEIWVPSGYVRDSYVRSGVDLRKVVVIPNGVDPSRFHPGVEPIALPTTKSFRFLFVGGTIYRKGPDLLLQTYLETFTPEDDVCLVIKDLGANSYYQEQGLGKEIRLLQADRSRPEILYLEDEYPYSAMPGLYAACHCLVHPYRGEGFGLPIAEAMASGLPVIVPGYGACLDFCDSSVAYLVPGLEVRQTAPRVGNLRTVETPSFVEVDRAALGLTMRRAFTSRQEARALGLRASAKVSREFTWKRAAELVVSRIEALARKPIRRFEVTSGPASPLSRVESPEPAEKSRKELSVCIIARNEEQFLSACLASVQGVADEIVLLDTGSSDRTMEIAREWRANVYQFPWNNDFAAARNESLRRAVKDWILVLDADQTLDPRSHEEIRHLIQTDRRVGYMLRQLSYADEVGEASVLEHLNLRLFPNQPDIRYVGRVHEQLVPTRVDLPWECEPCGVVVHDQGFRPQFRATRKSPDRDREALEEMCRQDPNEPFHAYNLGMTYQILGRSADAERELRRAITLCSSQLPEGTFPNYLLSCYVTLAHSLASQDRHLEASDWCRKAIELAPDFADAHLVLGLVEARLGHLEAALRAYERALGCQEGPAYAPTDRAARGWKALLGMGEVRLLQERWSDAVESLEAAQRLSTNPSISEKLRLAYERLGRRTETAPLREGPPSLALDATLTPLDSQEVESRLMQAQAALEGGKLLDCDSCLRPLRPLLPDHLEIGLIEAEYLWRVEKAQKSAELLRLLAKRHPGSTAPLAAYGRQLAAQGSPDEALEFFFQALRLDDSDPGTLTSVGLLLAELGYTAEAEQSFRAALALRPDYAEAEGALLAIQTGEKRRRRARQHSKRTESTKTSGRAPAAPPSRRRSR